MGDIPATTGRSPRGTPLITMLSNTAQGTQEGVINRFVVPENSPHTQMLFLTKQGRIKRVSLGEFTNLTRRGITILKLKDDDELLFSQFTAAGANLVLASSGGRLLRFTVNDEQLPILGRTAMGLQAFRLSKSQEMVGCVTVGANDQLLLITQEGYAKRIPANQLKASNRGDLGIQSLKFINKTDYLASVVRAIPGTEVALMTNKDRLVRVTIDTIPVLNKDATGENVVKLNRDERIITVVEVRV